MFCRENRKNVNIYEFPCTDWSQRKDIEILLIPNCKEFPNFLIAPSNGNLIVFTILSRQFLFSFRIKFVYHYKLRINQIKVIDINSYIGCIFGYVHLGIMLS